MLANFFNLFLPFLVQQVQQNRRASRSEDVTRMPLSRLRRQQSGAKALLRYAGIFSGAPPFLAHSIDISWHTDRKDAQRQSPIAGVQGDTEPKEFPGSANLS